MSDPIGPSRHSLPLPDHPTAADLKRWATSHWIDYQAWLFHHSFVSLQDFWRLRQTALGWPAPPLISVVTPVFNTPPAYLRECVYSVQTQAYPHWELCLVDDGSDRPDTLACVDELTSHDPRLRLFRLPQNRGICQATNEAIRQARGEYVAFVDHDDRLATDALYYVAEMLLREPETDIVYTDRDMVSPEGYRHMHLFKPAWSPETLLSGNYLFHLLVYRRSLLNALGGMRSGLEGSQDYDLILRATDSAAAVRHVPKILYHWRQHPLSVSLQPDVKDYAFRAGLRALQDTLQRRGVAGTATENTSLWRGHYRVHLQPPAAETFRVVTVTDLSRYAKQVTDAWASDPDREYLVILGPGVQPVDDASLLELVSWLQIPQVSVVTGKVLDPADRLLHAGLVQRHSGVPLAVYAGHPETTPGYMAVTAITRNVSAPHPACCAIKRSAWQSLQGVKQEYMGPHALLDFALRLQESGSRVVYAPFARFTATEWATPDAWPEPDRQRFQNEWEAALQRGDPYYHPRLTLERSDMGIDMHWPMDVDSSLHDGGESVYE